MIRRLKKYTSFYKIAHNQRVKLYHLKWRLFMMLLVAATMILIYEYLQGRYPYGVYDAIKGTKFLLADRVFEWFSIGVIFGVVALSVLYEGEFILSVRRLVKHFEQQTLSILHQARARKSSRVPAKLAAKAASGRKRS
ncbi:hypothetical protein HYV43_04440 [Candidatus Micrarchaeota archaeon]|nr:hypothetical protein [Candidatus Micrarchaeota archaeon]